MQINEKYEILMKNKTPKNLSYIVPAEWSDPFKYRTPAKILGHDRVGSPLCNQLDARADTVGVGNDGKINSIGLIVVTHGSSLPHLGQPRSETGEFSQRRFYLADSHRGKRVFS